MPYRISLAGNVKHNGLRSKIGSEIEISDHELEFFTKNNLIMGEPVIVDEDMNTDSNETPAKDLIKMIEQSTNISHLQDTLEKEFVGRKRKTVITALKKRLKELD